MKKIINFFKQRDKQLHILICFISSIIHPMLGIGLGIGKEYGDKCCPTNKWDWMDIVADVIGLTLGSLIRMLIIFIL